MGDKRYTDERADSIARTAESKGWHQGNMGRTAKQVAEDMASIEMQYGPLTETERLIAQSHMDEQHDLVDKIVKHPYRRR